MRYAANHIHRVTGIAAITAILIALGGCDSSKDSKSQASLDAKLVNNSANPAAAEADQATDSAGSGGVGTRTTGKPLSPADARAEALRLAGGTLMEAPPASKSVTSTKEPLTLEGKVADNNKTGCDRAQMGFGMEWVDRMPAAFPVYPGGTVTEAAGASNAPCDIRAVSFTTPVPAKDVMDFYYTMARRNGFSSERLEQNGGDVLGGTREKDDRAYYLSLGKAPDGGTAVDLIANGGR